MKRHLLAILALASVVTLSRADYVVIIVNLNAPPPTNQTGGAAGGGMLGGGMLGGSRIGGGPGRVGAGGMPGSGAGMLGSGQMGGMLGSGSGYMGGMLGSGSGYMGGMLGSVSGYMGGGPGRPGGAGMPGMPGMPGMGGDDGADEAPDFLVTVVEMQSYAPTLMKAFMAEKSPMRFKHPWGSITFQKHKDSQIEIIPLTNNAGRMQPSVKKEFQTRLADLEKNKASTEEQLNLARWALKVGLLDEFTKVMDKLAETEKSNSAVTSYVKIKADLAKPGPKDTLTAKWKQRGLDRYTISVPDEGHYAVLHSTDKQINIKTYTDRLERSFQKYYYWWALRGIVLPLPKERMVAIVTDQREDFKRLEKHLSSSPVFTAGFFARREGLSVFSTQRNDESYVKLDQSSKSYWADGYNRTELIKGDGFRGIPRKQGVLPQVMLRDAEGPRLRALLLKALEDEWEKTSLSHEASRQLLFATGMLPRNVHAPEWVQFGVGSFFEVPLQSPFGGPGCTNPYWYPRFIDAKDNKDPKKRYGSTPYDALISVITDGYFRGSPPLGVSPEAYKRRGRAAAWALTFFLANQELPGLQAYFKEISRMPRDVELDGKVLRLAFARAFGAVNADGTENRVKMDSIARRWFAYLDKQPQEAKAIHTKIAEAYAKMNKPTTSPPTGGPGGIAPGGPGGTGTFRGGVPAPGGIRGGSPNP